MSSITTGIFTLIGAFGGIWLKDHLDRKKSDKATQKQKAVEAFAIAGSLMNSCVSLKVSCAHLIKNNQYDYGKLLASYPYTGSEDMKQLELLIIENFYDVGTRTKLLAVETNLTSYSGYLYSIITSITNQSSQYPSQTFTEETKRMSEELVQSCHDLRSRLIDEYISKPAPRVTFFSLLEGTKKRIKDFFTK